MTDLTDILAADRFSDSELLMLLGNGFRVPTRFSAARRRQERAVEQCGRELTGRLTIVVENVPVLAAKEAAA